MFFCVVIGAFALGNAMPSVQNFSQARGAAYALWEIIDTVTYFSYFKLTFFTENRNKIKPGAD